MPIYEYQCAECSGKFEVLTSFAQRDRAHACPSCDSARTEVLVSRFASFGDEAGAMDFSAPAMGGGGGCACGGACSCGGH